MVRPSSGSRAARRLISRWLLGLAALVAAACDVPNFEGPQIQNPPQGFLLADAALERRMFQQHEVTFRTSWVKALTDVSTIHVHAHPGVLGMDDVVAAQDSARRYAQDPDVRFGQVEPLTVDGRQAWGWEERVESPTRGLVWVAYRAAVPYDTVTYALELFSGDPAIKRAAPDTLRAIVATFAIGETTWNLPLIAVLAGGLLFVASALRSRAQARAARLKSIHLVKVAKKPGATEHPTAPVGAAALPRPVPPQAAPPGS